MQRIINAQLLDVIPYQQGFLYSKKDYMDSGSIKVSFFFFNQVLNSSEPVVKKTYLQAKFGNAYQTIAEHLGDFINCDTSFFPNGAVAVLYKTGELYIFTATGNIAINCHLLYQDAAVQCPVVDDKCIWCVVPERNSIVNYSPNEQSVLLRIGGGKSNAFNCPVSVIKILDKLYICNKDSYKIRTIKLEDYSVKDYRTFNEPVYKYFQVYDKEYAVLDSGLYML